MLKSSRVRTSADMNSSLRSRRRTGWAGAVAVLLASSAVALAGCGGTSSGNSTAGSAPAGSGGTPASGQTASSNKAAQFSQCMRAHGVPSFPDPDATGHLDLKVTKGGPLDPSSPAFKSAEQQCKSLAPPGLGGSAPSEQMQNATLRFVTCMRKNGVPNFPDPKPNGAMIIQSGNGVDPNSPQFKSAIQTCRKLLPGGGTGGAALGA